MRRKRGGSACEISFQKIIPLAGEEGDGEKSAKGCIPPTLTARKLNPNLRPESNSFWSLKVSIKQRVQTAMITDLFF